MKQSISAHVLDLRGRPIANAVIELGGKAKTKTDSNGAFVLQVSAPAKRMAITVVAAGFVTNTRIVTDRSGRVPPIILAPIAHSTTIDAQAGADLALGRTRLEVPSNAFVDERGRPVRGAVRLEYTLLDPSDAAQRSAAMGDYTGRMLDGGAPIRSLRSYGIFQIRAMDRTGKRLELAKGAGIRFTIQIAERQRINPPNRMGLFNFDRVEGRWVQQGWAELVPETLSYQGTFTQIDYGWNLDDPTTVTCVTVKVVKIWNGQPMGGITVTAKGDDYESSGPTNSDGLTCLLVRRNTLIHLSAYGEVGTSVWMTYPWVDTVVNVPDIASDASDCGDSVKCPLVATLEVDLIVGMMERLSNRFLGSQ